MNESELVLACRDIGVHVAYLPYTLAGAYFHDQSLIIIDARQSPQRQLEALAHEYVHALCGHTSRQCASVERMVDRRASRLLIDSEHYRSAETLHDGNIAGIASELGVTPALASAYRDSLTALDATP